MLACAAQAADLQHQYQSQQLAPGHWIQDALVSPGTCS